jgi:HK97 family phage portal protein
VRGSAILSSAVKAFLRLVRSTRCVTLIASDIGKIRLAWCSRTRWHLVGDDVTGVLAGAAKPNKWQNRIKFFEQWVISKLLHGNTYVLLQRDNRGVVVAMYVLDPTQGEAAGRAERRRLLRARARQPVRTRSSTTSFPASEIIHDTMVALYHPLCGVSPLTACGAAATHGLTIQENSQKFFRTIRRLAVS